MAQDRRKGRVELAKRIVKQAGHSVKEIADREIANLGLRPQGLRPQGLRPQGLRPEGLRQ